MEKEQYINGVNFKQISDAILDYDRMDNLSNLPNESIIWCKTEFIDKVFAELKNSNKSFKLITHCSDHSIDEEKFLKKPNCIKKWYAQNVNYKHNDLIPLPIGIENHTGPHKGNFIDIEYLCNNKTDFSSKILNKIYCNFSLYTNANRGTVLNNLETKQLAYRDVIRSFSEYCNILKQFLFIASPRGNGIDCHRTWEALYMGSIPIVEKHFMYDSYKNLPIIQIEDWNKLTLDQLQIYINDYERGVLFKNTEELNIQFYFNKIKQF